MGNISSLNIFSGFLCFSLLSAAPVFSHKHSGEFPGPFSGESGKGSSMIAWLPDKSDRNQASISLQSTSSATTVWNGTSWDSGSPSCNVNAIISGDYQGPGFSCRNLTVLAGKKLWPSSQVELCGNAISNSSDVRGMIYLTGDTVQEIQGYFDDLSLDNDSGAVVTAPSGITGTLKLWKGVLKTNNNLTFRSTAQKTARLAKVEPGAGISGKITMERFVGGGAGGWHFLGTPIREQAQSNWSDDFSLLPGYIFRHNESGTDLNGWIQNSDSIRLGKGYRVFLDQSFFNSSATIRNTGTPYVGDYDFDVSYTPGAYGGGGWNLLSNPYPCELNWDAVSRSNIGAQVHFWSGNKYISYNAGTQIGVNGAGPFIPSSQGFFVRAFGASPQLSVSEDAKPQIPANPGFYRTAFSIGDEVARLKLISATQEQDETAIRWMPEAQPFFEDEYDTDKPLNPGINFFSKSSDGRRASIQGRNFIQADSVNLGYSLPAPGTYFLEISLGSALFNGKTWRLRDNESGFSFPVTANMFFPFTVDPDFLQSEMRFTLIGNTPTMGINSGGRGQELFVYPNPAKDQVRVQGLQTERAFVMEDPGGRKVLEGTSSGLLDLSRLAPGMYFLRFPDDATTGRIKISLVR